MKTLKNEDGTYTREFEIDMTERGIHNDFWMDYEEAWLNNEM